MKNIEAILTLIGLCSDTGHLDDYQELYSMVSAALEIIVREFTSGGKPTNWNWRYDHEESSSMRMYLCGKELKFGPACTPTKSNSHVYIARYYGKELTLALIPGEADDSRAVDFAFCHLYTWLASECKHSDLVEYLQDRVNARDEEKRMEKAEIKGK